MVSSFGKLALVACASAVVSAAGMAALSPQPLRLARFGADGVSSASSQPGFGSVAKGADGHFWADAEVNGKPVRFLVDTGATAVALTPEDAQRLGIDTTKLKGGYNVTTVGGSARASAVTLASISINGARLENVQAMVVSDGLDVSLLGMSYLGRLTRFEATRDTLRFEP